MITTQAVPGKSGPAGGRMWRLTQNAPTVQERAGFDLAYALLPLTLGSQQERAPA
jgi:hypothetical protein